jgi:hypothetical protein
VSLYVFSRGVMGWTVRAHDPLQAKLSVEAYLQPLLADPPWIKVGDTKLSLGFEPGDARILPRDEGRAGVLGHFEAPFPHSVWMWP